MWKRGGRSSALDRAQELLSAKKSSRGHNETVRMSTLHTAAVGGPVRTRPASPHAHPLFLDLSDLSSVSSAPEHGTESILGPAAAGKTEGRKLLSSEDFRPQSSLGGGGGRFLKKPPPPVTNSNQSPVNNQIQQGHEHRNLSSSQRGSQTTALKRLAQIENRFRGRKLVQEQQKTAENLTSDVGLSPTPASREALESSVSAQSSSNQSLKGKRFLKNKAAVHRNNSNISDADSQKRPDVCVRSGSRSRAAEAGLSAPLGTKSARAVSAVSLESDEEDMRKLLGDSLESADNSLLIPERATDKKTNRRIHSPLPQSSPPPHFPASPHRSSPFRFTGQAQAHFSPSALSPSPSPPPLIPPRSPGGVDSLPRVGGQQRSPSSMSGGGELLSLEELFSEDTHSQISTVTSEDFKINVMTLDDLVPATIGLTEEKQGKEGEDTHDVLLLSSPNGGQQHPPWKEEKEEQVADYHSDFESDSRTGPDHSVGLVSEHLGGNGEEVVSEVREEASHSDMSSERTEGNYSSDFSDTSGSCTSDHTQRLDRSRSSRSSVSHGSWTRPTSRQTSTRKVLKEATAQTRADPLAYTWPTVMAASGPAMDKTCLDPSPVVAHTLSAEIVEALSTSNPAVFALNELFKQQLAITRRFIESSRQLHDSLVQSLGPPNYRYTTLEETIKYIRKHRPPKLTIEEAIEEVLLETGDYHRI